MTSDSLMRLNSTPPPSRRQRGPAGCCPSPGGPRARGGVRSTHNPRAGHAVTALQPGLYIPPGCPGKPAGKGSWGEGRAPRGAQLCPVRGPREPPPARPGRAGGDGGRRKGRSRAPPPLEPPPTALPGHAGPGRALPPKERVFAGRTRRRGRRPIPPRALVPLPSPGRSPHRAAPGAPALPAAPRPAGPPGHPEREVILEVTGRGLPKATAGNTKGISSAW